MTKKNKTLALEQKWESLTLANNFIFYKVMRHHPDACQHLIEMLLGIKIEKLEIHSEETIELDVDSKGIRLDVFVKDANQMYDVELQATDTKELPERSRYYQGMMDLDMLKEGQKYKELKTSHVIFICMKDIFDNELPVCTFENICIEDGKTKLNDRAIKHFFMAEKCAKLIEDKEVREFFEFLVSSTAKSNYTKELEDYVIDARHNMQWRFQYMTWERQRAYDFDDGYDAGKQDSAKNLLRMDLLTPEQIAQAVSLPLEQVRDLQKELEAEKVKN